jgi:effector-binding domain-containing protein
MKAYIQVNDKDWREAVNELKANGLTVIDNFYEITVPVEQKQQAAKVLWDKKILYHISDQPCKSRQLCSQKN